jgi:NAD(P)-dependent dehydrogenase (short-subunit alcohol dehydrogenase family)
MNIMPSVLITGSNRGLGLEWARQYAQEGWRVFATCRHPHDALDLQQLKREYRKVTLHRLDVTKVGDIRSVQWELENQTVDILVSNAGIYLDKRKSGIGCFRFDDWLRTLEVNSLGGLRVVEALIGNLARSSRRLIVAVSSHMGSIADIQEAGHYYYRSSKAALNAAMAGLAVELKPQGIGVLILHPGGVKTRMGPSSGISPEESVRGMRHIAERFRLEDSGTFLRYDGVKLPW